MSEINGRLAALNLCLSVVEHGRSLSQSLPSALSKIEDRRDRAFVQNLAFGTLRWQHRLQTIAKQLLQKPLKEKDQDVNQLILIGLYQILYMDTPEHAAVSETVKLTQKIKKPWAKALINGVLRNFLRDIETLCEKADQNPVAKYSHPQWLIEALKKNYPDHWQTICQANNQPAPTTLRINCLQNSVENYLETLSEIGMEADKHPVCASAIELRQSTDITQLPDFEKGAFSIQDAAAQQAAHLLAPKPNEKVLDACAAPGGKTTHLLEISDNQADILALEIEEERIDRLEENLQRLQLEAEIRVGDASQPSDWWDGELFDKILLDAPCSATGIIRRHPDIKWHRKPQDIKELVQRQAQILQQLWKTLKPGGQLLYATCSVLPQENTLQVSEFIAKTADAFEIPLNVDWGIQPNGAGRQILPGDANMDGFFYCLIEKRAETP